ncbi:MAG: Uma2 family endonuclease, partial [Gemmataceae bacterium]
MSALPAPARLSIEQFAALYDGAHVELVNGFVKECPMVTPKHGFVCMEIAWLLKNYLDVNDLGRIATNDSWVRTGPDSVRGGDVCFFSYQRLARGAVPDGVLAAVPDLVVEVRSPSERWTEVFAKVIECIKGGVRVVVVLDPGSATASVYRDEEQRVFRVGD